MAKTRTDRQQKQIAYIDKHLKNITHMARTAGKLERGSGQDPFMFSVPSHKTPDTPQETTPTGFLQASAYMLYEQIQLLTFVISFFVFPEETIIHSAAPDLSVWKEWENDLKQKLLKDTDPGTPETPEQIEDRYQKALKADLQGRQERFISCAFSDVLKILEPIKGKYQDAEPADSYNLKLFTALLYFSLLREENSTSFYWLNAAPITAKAKAFIKSLFNSVDNYFSDNPDSETKGREALYIDFLKSYIYKSLKNAQNVPQVESYTNILQGKPLNALSHISQKSMNYDVITGKGEITTPENVQILLENFNNVSLSVPTHKVLDMLVRKITAGFPLEEKGKPIEASEINKHRETSLSVNEYMTLCGLKDKKAAREQLKEAMQTIYNLSLEWDYEYSPDGKNGKNKRTVHGQTRIIDFMGNDIIKNPIQNGTVYAKFTFDMAEYLSRAQIMPYPNKLFTINGKLHPHSLYIGRKLAEHHNMNIGKQNANRISIKSLIQCLPDLPKYEDEKKKARQYTRNIIDPFEKSLEALKNNYDILRDYKYCNPKGEPLTNEQLKKYDYDEWIQWLLEFDLIDYPDQTERLEKIEASRKRKAAAKKKATQTHKKK